MNKNVSLEINKNASSVSTAVRPAKSRIKIEFRTEESANVHKLPFGVITVICIMTIMALFITYLSVRVNDISTEISSIKSEIADVREKAADAKAALADKKDVTLIREAAENELGMVRAENLPSHYVNVQNEDEIVIYEEDKRDNEYTISSLLSAFGETVSAFIEYLR